MTPSSDPRRDPAVQKLEERLAFLEHDVETLDGVVRSLHDQMDSMGKELGRMREDLSQTRNALYSGVPDADASADADSDLSSGSSVPES